ncbi:MAG: hypothetical protein ACKVT2_06255 [Saprospiraceae bacterium]
MQIKMLFWGLFLSFGLVANAQKLKEKKDIVYLDDVPQYKLEKSGSLIKGFSFRVLSLSNDTLIRYNFKSINIPGLPHEGIGTFWSYHNVVFATLGKSVEIDPTSKRAIMDQLQENGVITDGKVSPEGAEKFIAANKDFQKTRVQMDSLALRRKGLLADKAYKEYAKTLASRSRWDDNVSLAGNNITMGEMMAPKNIGRWKIGTVSDYGTMYHILKPDGKQAASIFFEKGRQRVFTRTDLDGAGREEFILSDFTMAHLVAQIKYLVMNGYF